MKYISEIKKNVQLLVPCVIQHNIQPDYLSQDCSITSSPLLCTTDTDEGQMDTNQDRAVQPDLTTQATAFVINAWVKHRLSQRGMNDIVAGVQQYQSSLVSNLRSQIEQVLKKHLENTPGHLQKEVMDVFDSFVDPFTSVTTTFRQNSAMKKQLSILDADEIPISQTICKRKRGASKDFFIKNKVFHYIPLVKSLEQFLSHPKIFSMIEKGPQRCKEGFFQDIVRDLGVFDQGGQNTLPPLLAWILPHLYRASALPSWRKRPRPCPRGRRGGRLVKRKLWLSRSSSIFPGS
ncbi:uncharacterized protein LOC121948439 [Plectropomus leopardus]|uniref:uncharacterized protein LOC121948439 n=1 Tax=Plectropomus leopardus TaxID=160734 RepID=UPI001C4BF903|nr:uncharacterized protein LOC121948439 [Plectropomus leopardus]